MTFDERLTEVKRMDYEVCNNFNDENNIDVWLTLGCPDCSTEDDYIWFAEDEDEYTELVKLYERLKKREDKSKKKREVKEEEVEIIDLDEYYNNLIWGIND